MASTTETLAPRLDLPEPNHSAPAFAGEGDRSAKPNGGGAPTAKPEALPPRHPLETPAIAAFLGRRADQFRHGHTPASDMDRTPYDLAHKVAARLQSANDRLMGHPNAERLEMALRVVEVAGAMTIALYDRISAELALARRAEAAE